MDSIFSESVVKSLRGLRLMEYDWDGSGGLPMRSDVADTAIAVFDDPDVIGDSTYGLPLPSISLSSNGTVEVAFAEPDGRQLFLTFECEGVITYVKVFDDEQTSVEGVIRVDTLTPSPDDFVELRELFGWMVETEGF